jgi:hypothetical protein
MKKVFLLANIVIWAFHSSSFAQEQKPYNKSQHHGLCFEFWGTSTTYNIHYLFLKKLNKKNMFIQTDAIAGYRPQFSGKSGIIHVYNYSIAVNFGYLHKSGKSILLGWGLGYDRGRIGIDMKTPPDETNKSVVSYLRLNYSRRLINDRLILGVSLVYGIKLKEFYVGNDSDFNEKINEFQNWFAPAVSIGYCFGKKYFQKEKIGTE